LKQLLITVFMAVSLLTFQANENRGFIKSKAGVLIKVDPASGFIMNYPEKKGPNPDQIPIKFTKDEFDSILNSITDNVDKKILQEAYPYFDELNSHEFIYKENVEIKTKVRSILLKLNKKNEIDNDLLSHGSPSPHRFPRVFNAKSKPYFDITFNWGVKFANNITLDFGVNLSNFVMPSLEIGLKYNFVIPGYPVEPFVGGAIYGGFMDGFPIGISALAGVDIFPCYLENKHSDNFFLSAELRIGAVIVIPVYYDTGLDTETIYKKLGVLAEGGFYMGTGYIFNNL